MGFDALRIATTGMLAAQKAMEVTGNNVANVGNASYTRQRTELGDALGTPFVPGGVRVLDITRMRDIFADARWRTEAGNKEFNGARSAVLTRVEGSLGDLDQGLSSLYDTYFNAWNNLSLNPRDTGTREAVMAAARDIAGEYRRIDSEMTTQMSEAQRYAGELLDQVNSLAGNIANLNQAIAEAKATGAERNDLMDQRDAAIDKLSSMVGAKVRYGSSGEPEVVIGGVAIVDGSYHAQFQIVGNGSTVPYAMGVIGGASLASTGGQVGGLLEVINTDLPALRSQLDTAAVAFMTSANNIHTAGFDINGNIGIDLFYGTSASTMYLNGDENPTDAFDFTADLLAASASGVDGDGNQALAMAQMRQDTAPTSALNEMRAFVVDLGSVVDAATRDSDLADSAMQGAENARQEASGVNADEEMVDLIRFQRAFQASAKAVSVADEVLDTIINRMIN